MDETSASIIQDDWIAISEKLRLETAKRIADIPAMSPEELEKLADALRSVYWLEQLAHSYDKKLDLELQKIFADT